MLGLDSIRQLAMEQAITSVARLAWWKAIRKGRVMLGKNEAVTRSLLSGRMLARHIFSERVAPLSSPASARCFHGTPGSSTNCGAMVGYI